MAMVEPFLSVRARAVGWSTCSTPTRRSSRSTSPPALGASSAYTWLKLPVVDELDRVMDATTLPTLLLGGDPQGDPHDTYASWGARARPPRRARSRRRTRPALPARTATSPRPSTSPAELGARERGRRVSDNERWVLPLGQRRREDWAVVVDETVDGWPHTGLYAGDAPARAEPRPSTGRVGARRRAALRVGRRHGASTRTATSTRPSSPGGASVFAGPTDVAYVPRDCDARRSTAVGGPAAGRRLRRPRGASGPRRRSATWPPRTCPSSCAARAARPARSATSASRASSTPTRSSPARSSRRPATGAPTRRTSTTRSAPGVETELEEIYYFEVARRRD